MSVLEFLRAVTPFVTLLALILVGIAGYFAKKFIDGMTTRFEQLGTFVDEQLKALRERQDDHEKEFLRFQAQLPRLYTLKDDHIRHVTILERKIDQLGETFGGAIGQVNADVKLILRELSKRGADG